MKLKILSFSIALSGVLMFSSCNQSTNFDNVEIKTLEDSVSYSYGLMLATDFQNGGLDSIFKPELIAKAMNDQFAEKGLLQPEAAQTILQKYFTEKQRIDNEKRIKSNEDFLLENKTKEGVVTLPSGLQYKVITEGKGPKPAIDDKVIAHYHGTLIDGTIFESSVQKGQPATFLVQGVIPGWIEALQLMPVGSKWKLFIPYKLGYGERGSRVIPPFSTLIFEIELISIEK